MTDSFLSRFHEYILQHELLQPGDRITAAVSGGADSVCLLVCLDQLRQTLPFSLQAVHVHHGIRGAAADGDAAWTEDFCRQREIGFQLKKIPPGSLARMPGRTLEEAARIRRYEVLEEAAGEGKIAVGHHRDDQAETVLYHLFRGSGLRGASGMRPSRGKILRPLLWAGRREIEEYLRALGITWRTDETNMEDAAVRNRIRHTILPAAEQGINARAAEHLAEFAADAAESCELIDSLVSEWEKTAVSEEEAGTAVSLEAVQNGHPVVVRGGLHRIIGRLRGSRVDLERNHVEALRKLADAQAGRRLDLPGVNAVRRYRDILLTPREPGQSRDTDSGGPDEAGGTAAGESPGKGPVLVCRRLERPEDYLACLPKKPYTKWFDYDKIKGTPVLRTRRPEDSIWLQGSGHKPVRRLLIDHKIPAAEREKILVLADDEQVLWVVGVRTNDLFRVSEDTRTVLEAELTGL